MTQILNFIDRWAGGAAQVAAILLPILFYLLAYRYADKRTIEYRRLRDVTFVVLLILSSGNLVKLTNEQYSKWTESQRKPIEVSPEVISMTLTAFETSQTVSVTNRSDSTLHQIWIRIVLEDCAVRWNEIRIKPRFPHEMRRLTTGPEGNLNVSSDVWGLGVVDSTGRELLCVLLRSIGPKSTLGFDLTLPAKTDTTTTLGCRLRLDAWSYSTQPTVFVERDRDGGREGGLRITPPENVKVLGICTILSTAEN